MHAIRIDATVTADHTLTLTLPSDVPVGPAEVILLYRELPGSVNGLGNGDAILSSLSRLPSHAEGFWKGAGDELQEARDGWDVD